METWLALAHQARVPTWHLLFSRPTLYSGQSIHTLETPVGFLIEPSFHAYLQGALGHMFHGASLLLVCVSKNMGL